MIKYKCPNCGATCNTSHCYDCDKDIPFSCRFDESSDDAEEGTATTGYKCPTCGATCRTPYCYDCDKDLPMRKAGGWHTKHGLTREIQSNLSARNSMSSYFWIDKNARQFRINGNGISFPFSDLINYELCENNSVIQESGFDNAVIGGVLFGEVGAIVGAQARDTIRVVDSLYIRISLKSGGMKRITFITAPTSRDTDFYRRTRKIADEIISGLDYIVSDNKNRIAEQSNQDIPDKTKSVPLIADELLKLKQLLDMGVLTDEEFNRQKQKLLNK